MMKKSALALLFAGAGIAGASAQQENTLYFMNTVAQSNYYNPATKPAYDFNMCFPCFTSAYGSTSSSSIKFNDVFKKNTSGGTTIPIEGLSAKMDDKNYFRALVNKDWLSLHFRLLPKLNIDINITDKFDMRGMYPKSFIELIEKGNAPFIGQTVSGAPEFDFTHYREYGIGASYQLNDKIRIGVKPKIYFGKSNITTKVTDLSFTTAADYTMTATGEGWMRTAGFSSVKDVLLPADGMYQLNPPYTNAMTSSKLEYLLANARNLNSNNPLARKLLQTLAQQYSLSEAYSYRSSNAGLGIDLGITYDVTDKLTLGASLLDLGFISWKKDVRGMKSAQKFNTSFDGFDGDPIIKGDVSINGQIVNMFNEALQPLKDIMNSTDKDNANYRTNLPTRFYLSGTYKLQENFKVGANFFGEVYKGKMMSSLGINATKDFGKWVTLSGTYTMAHKNYANLGMGLALNLTPAQIFVVSDNMISGMFTGISGTNNYNFRMGFNMAFGKLSKRSFPQKMYRYGSTDYTNKTVRKWWER